MDGAWQIVEVWESEEYARRFDAERLEPAIEAVTGRRRSSEPPMVSSQLHLLITP